MRSPARRRLAEALPIALSASNFARLFAPRSGLMPKLVLAAGASYLFLPIDLIPDRLGLVGHLDEAGFLLLGFAGGLRLSMPPVGSLVVSKPNHGIVRQWAKRLTWQTMRIGTGSLVGRPMLRLMLGRWPERLEVEAFRAGLNASSHGLPPLLRAAAYVPAASSLLNRSMLLSAVLAGDRAEVGGAGSLPPLKPAQMMGDPLALWQGPKIRFLHLEKTAGSSLTTVLTAQFHPRQIDPDPHRNIPPHERLAFPEETLAAQRRAKLVWGHYDLPSLRRLDAGSRSFTLCIFREPRQRVLSLYYYWWANKEDLSPMVRFARETGLLAFLRTRDPLILNYIDNLYVRRLTGSYVGPNADRLVEAPEEALAAALAGLNMLDFIGLSDRLEDSLARLGRSIGFTPPAQTPRVNVLAQSERNVFLPYRPVAREPVTAEIDAELDRLTRLDQVVYRQAKRRFWQWDAVIA